MSGWSRMAPATRGTTILVVIGALVLGAVWGGMRWHAAQQSTSDSGVGEIRTVEPGHFKSEESMALGDSDEYKPWFAVPGGTIELKVLFAPTMGDYDEVHAPRDGALLEVSLEHGSDAGVLDIRRIWLRAGDFRVPVFKEEPGAGDPTHIAIPRDDARLELEVEVDGRRQTVDVRSGHRRTGAFAPFYRASDYDRDVPEEQGTRGLYSEDQARGRSGDLRWYEYAEVDYRRVPYTPLQGWAKKGREWLVLDSAEFRVSSIRVRTANSAIASTKERRARLTKSSKGRLTAAGGRVVRGGTTALFTDSGDEDSSESDDDQPNVYFRPDDAVIDVPIGKVTRLTFTLRTPLASPRDTTLRATTDVQIQVPSSEKDTVR